MKTACYRGSPVSPSEFEVQAGKDWKARNRYPICCICKNRVHPYGTHSTSTSERFDHEDGVRTCPLSVVADPRYAALRPRDINPCQSRHVKLEYKSWYSRKAKVFCKHLVGSAFSQALYNKMLDEADRLEIWAYSDLRMWCIPYILLTLVDYESLPHSGKSCYRFAFVFDKPAGGTIDDLWLKPSDCKLKKVFSPSGKLMAFPEGNPYPVSEEFFTSVLSSP